MNCFFYSTDKSVFTNKAKALEYGRVTNQIIKLYYHDEVYSKVNWKAEPTHTLDFYYKEQAQKIRDEYDYVILFYSGGYDSTNILETFHFNGIKLDKIVCVGAFKQDSYSGSDANHNAELYYNSFPYITELGLSSITQICDYSDYFDDINNFSIVKYGNQWADTVGGCYSPHHWFWNDIENYVIPSSMKDKKVALIFGRDKTQLIATTDKKLGFMFNDLACLSYAEYTTKRYSKRISFYWDPANTSILVKQLHFLRANPTSSIYNLKKPLNYKSPKSGSQIISLRDNFLLSKKDSSIYDFYKAGMSNLFNRFGTVSVEKKTIIPSAFYEII